jgi:hypothetical protein
MADPVVDTFVSLPLRDCGRPLSRAAVAGWERSVGLGRPPEYREFLEVFNGGKFYPRYFGYLYPVEFSGTAKLPPISGGVGVFCLFSLNEPWDWRNLETNFNIHEGRIPKGCIPIAEPGEDLILLDCQNGEVILWSRDCESNVEPEENRISLARSFVEFAQGIKRAPRSEWLLNITAVEEPLTSIQLHDLDGLKRWVTENGPLDKLPDGGVRLLKEACSDGEDFEGAEWLLKQGVDATGPLQANVKTPIQLADKEGCGDIVVLLLEHGANADHLFRDGQKPQRYILDFVKQWQAGQRTSRRGSPFRRSE